MNFDRHRLRLGYACAWWQPREQTWSYIAARLRKALAGHADIEDIEAQRSLAGKAALGALSLFRPGVPWQYAPVERRLVDRAVRRGVRRIRPDAVLGIAQVDTPTDVPTFFYQDTNAVAGLAYQGETGYTNLLPARQDLLASWSSQQADRSRRADAVFAMSNWYAEFLVREQGVAADRVIVVPPGINNPPSVYRDPSRAAAGRVLFVGTEFTRKAGDVVLEAVRRLSAGSGRSVRVTLAGPRRWPLPGDIPHFVDFVGQLTPAQVGAVYAEHDVFAMPSRYEGFGIALAEALVAGLPCVARRAFAMPEIVEDGVTGALVASDDPDELAAAIDGVLSDPDIFARVAAARPALLARYDWHVAARTMVEHMEHICSMGR